MRKWFISYWIPLKESCSHFRAQCLLMGEGFFFFFQICSNFSRILNFFIGLSIISVQLYFIFISTQNLLLESPLYCDLNRESWLIQVLLFWNILPTFLYEPDSTHLCIQFMNRLTHSFLHWSKQHILSTHYIPGMRRLEK